MLDKMEKLGAANRWWGWSSRQATRLILMDIDIPDNGGGVYRPGH